MAIKTFPDIELESLDFGIRHRTQSFESALNGAIQTTSLPGARWEADITMPTLDGTDARKMRTFLASLKGLAGRFYLVPPDAQLLGSGSGTPRVNGGSQTGDSLVTDGWAADDPLVLAAGDYFEVGSELYMTTEDVASDSGGNATIPIVPVIRTSPNDGELLRLTDPRVIMRLDDDITKWALSSPLLHAISFKAVQALD